MGNLNADLFSKTYSFSLTLLVTIFCLSFEANTYAFDLSNESTIDVCNDNEIYLNRYFIHTTKNANPKDDNPCSISISPKQAEYPYIRLSVTSQGQLLIYHFFKQGSAKNSTGTFLYYFLPQVRPLRVTIDERENLHFHMPNGNLLVFDTIDGVFEIPDTYYITSQEVTSDNPIWLNILSSSKSTIIKIPFTFDADASNDPFKKISVVGLGYNCQLLNLHLFRYKFGGAEAVLKISNEEEFAQLISQQCPNPEAQLATSSNGGP